MTGMSGWNITVVIVCLLAGFFGLAIAEAIWRHASLSDLQGYFTFMFPLLSAFLGLGAGGLATYVLKNQQTQALKDLSEQAKATSAAAEARARSAEERAKSANQAAFFLARALPNDKLGELARQAPPVNDVLVGALWPSVTAPPATPMSRPADGQKN